jgi:hypothetical protein
MSVCFTVVGHECVVPRAFRLAMERLLSGEAIDFQQLATLVRETLCRKDLSGLLGELLTAGIIYLIPRETQASSILPPA